MKKVLSILLVLAMAVTVFAACGAPASSTPAAPAASGSTAEPAAPAVGGIEDGAKLVYWPMWAETEPQGQVIASAAEAFTDATGVEVEINWTGSRETRKLLQPGLDTGETIDVFDEDIERVNITWKDYLLDINDMYEASALKGAQFEALINVAKELGGGSLKSVPYQPSAFLMMYSKNAFTTAGIEAVPTNWEEFMAACEALKTAGITPITVDDAYMACFFGYMMDRIVGSETTMAVADGDFANEAVLETAKVIEEMISKGYIDTRAAANVYPAGQSNMVDGSVAMYLNGTWLPNEVRNQTPEDFQWGSFALPNIKEGGDGVESNNFGAQCFAINKDTQYPNAAFAFIEWMTSGEWDQTLADETLGVPMANDAAWPDALKDAKACVDATTNRLTWGVNMENDSNVNGTIKDGFAKMITGAMDAQGFADAFAAIKAA